MITGSKIIEKLVATKKEVKELQKRHNNDYIWEDVQNKLEDIITLIKRDMKIFGYN